MIYDFEVEFREFLALSSKSFDGIRKVKDPLAGVMISACRKTVLFKVQAAEKYGP